jgi:hypothetical protein
MSTKNISEAKDPDLRASVSAMHRAAELARKTALQTGTNLVVMKDGKIVEISAEDLAQTPLTQNHPKT